MNPVSIAISTALVFALFVSGLDNLNQREKVNVANNKIDSTANQLEQVKKENSELDSQIKDLQGQMSNSENSRNRYRDQSSLYQNQLKDVSLCLTKVFELIDTSSREDQMATLLALTAIQTPCERASEIIESQRKQAERQNNNDDSLSIGS